MDATGWIEVAKESPPKDGTNVMFLRKPPFGPDGNITIGFWHKFQNEPGWQEVGTCGKIVEEVWTHWQHLPDLPEV